MSEIGGIWRTVGGRRIFIKNGQDLSTAMKESGKFKKFHETWEEKKLEAMRKKDQQLDEITGLIELSQEELNNCSEVLNKYKENNLENILIYNKNTYEKIGNIENSGEHSRVGFSNNQLKEMQNFEDGSIIAIHNHPGNTTFSLNDITMCEDYKKLGGIMVVTEDYVYTLKYNKYNISNIELENKLSEANDWALDNYPQFSNSQLYHIAYKKVFDEIGWEYGRTKRKNNI